MTTEKEPVPIELSHPIIMQLLAKDEPVLIEEGLTRRNDGPPSAGDPLAASGAALCFPIRAQGQLTAIVALGRQLHGEAYGTDDCDLLRGIAHHVGALLSTPSGRRTPAAAELEALHRFSVFCLHDLKNLAARLSLVAQNAENHGKDPAFQESAMRTVADTAQKIITLMSKLSLKSFTPMAVATPEPIDLTDLIDEMVTPIRGERNVHVYVRGEPVPPVLAVREQIHQVLLNVVLNAQQAIGQDGTIYVTTGQQDGSVVVTIEDTGAGISASKLSTLFRPAQSSRPGGLGIGLYQCKQIVEAHQGTIQMRSEEGKGTQVRIQLPIHRPPVTIDEDSILRSNR
jgi:signal transduction histidine kinase